MPRNSDESPCDLRIRMGKRVPDETLERNTKVPVNEQAKNTQAERSLDANASLRERLRREVERQ